MSGVNRFTGVDYGDTFSKGVDTGLKLGNAYEKGQAKSKYSDAKAAAEKKRDDAISAAGDNQDAIKAANKTFNTDMQNAHVDFNVNSGDINTAELLRDRYFGENWSAAEAKAAGISGGASSTAGGGIPQTGGLGGGQTAPAGATATTAKTEPLNLPTNDRAAAEAAIDSVLGKNPYTPLGDAVTSVNDGYGRIFDQAHFAVGENGTSVTMQRPGEPLQTIDLTPEQLQAVGSKWKQRQLKAAGYDVNPTEPASEASSGAQATTAQVKDPKDLGSVVVNSQAGEPEQAVTSQQIQQGASNQGQPQAPVQQPQGQAMQTPQQAKAQQAQQAQTPQVQKAEAKFNKKAEKELGPEPTGKRGETFEYMKKREQKMYDLSLKFFEEFGKLPPWANATTLLNVAKEHETTIHNVNDESLKGRKNDIDSRKNDIYAARLAEDMRHNRVMEGLKANGGSGSGGGGGGSGKGQYTYEPVDSKSGRTLEILPNGRPSGRARKTFGVGADGGTATFAFPEQYSDKQVQGLLNAYGGFLRVNRDTGDAYFQGAPFDEKGNAVPENLRQNYVLSFPDMMNLYLGSEKAKQAEKDAARAEAIAKAGRVTEGTLKKGTLNSYYGIEEGDDPFAAVKKLKKSKGESSDNKKAETEQAMLQVAAQQAQGGATKDPNELGSSVVNPNWKAQQPSEEVMPSKAARSSKYAMDPDWMNASSDEDVEEIIAKHEAARQGTDPKTMGKTLAKVSESIAGSDAELRQQAGDMRPFPGDSSASERMVRRMTRKPKHAEYRTQHGHDGSNVPVQYGGDEMKPLPKEEKSIYEKAKDYVRTVRDNTRRDNKVAIETVKKARNEAKKSLNAFDKWLDRAVEENTKIVKESAKRGLKTLNDNTDRDNKALYNLGKSAKQSAKSSVKSGLKTLNDNTARDNKRLVAFGKSAKEVLSTPYRNAKKSLDEFGEDLDRGGKRVYKAMDTAQKGMHSAGQSVKESAVEAYTTAKKRGEQALKTLDVATARDNKALYNVGKAIRQSAADATKGVSLDALNANTKRDQEKMRAFGKAVKETVKNIPSTLNTNTARDNKRLHEAGKAIRSWLKKGEWTKRGVGDVKWTFSPGERLTPQEAKLLQAYFEAYEPNAKLNLKNRIVGKNDSAMIVSE